jgi:hypothetical protein
MSTEWSTRTVSISRRGQDRVTVEHTWLPAMDGLDASTVADWHLRELNGARADVEWAPLASAPQGMALRRAFASASGDVAGLAHYEQRAGRLHRFVATGPSGTDQSELDGALVFRVDEEFGVELTTLETRVLEQVLELDSVHFIGAAWWPALAPSARSLLEGEILAGLRGRGILESSSEAEVPESVRRALLPVLDADIIAVATHLAGGRTRRVAVGSRDGNWSVLTEAGASLVRFTAVGPDAVVARVIDELGLPAHDAAPDVDPSSPPSAIDGFWHVSLVRRARAGLEGDEFAWCTDASSRVWSVTPRPGSDRVTITLVGAADIAIALTSALLDDLAMSEGD